MPSPRDQSERGAARVTDSRASRPVRSLAPAVLLLVLLPGAAVALEGKLGLGLVRLDPIGQETERYSGPGWGVGLQLTALPNWAPRVLAGVAGFEYVNLSFRYTRLSGEPLRVIGQTHQYMSRLYIGSEIGPHGPGVLRPHVGGNVALVLYGFSADVVVPNGSDPEPVTQAALSEHRATFGYDVVVGMDVNPWNTVSFDAGVRIIKSFNVPQQLAIGTRRIHPGYIEGYFAVAVSLVWMGRLAGD